MGQRSQRWVVLGTAVLVFLQAGSVALAIPSPDVVVNVFTGMAQALAALGAACAGLGVGFVRSIRQGQGAGRKFAWWALVAVLSLSIGVNCIQHTAHAKDRLDRLQRNLVRKSTENGQVVRDVSLRELPFSQQVDHPLGLTPDQVEALLDQADRPLFVDVREDEERAAGSIPGTVHVRYPDLFDDPRMLEESSNPPLLLCFSGNRSGELAATFHEQGIECRFLIGGYEKWIAEGRRLVGRDPDCHSARDIAVYPNKDRLLDTADAERAYSSGDVVFLDARYPAEFDAAHLPNAINFPLRKMKSDEVAAALAALPRDKRYVGACYDKRSSFYAMLLGSKLSAEGMQWLGRYTLPTEFLESRSLALAPSREGLSLRAGIVWGFERLRGWVGSVGMAILLLVLGLRAILLPLSLLAERSTARERSARPQILRAEQAFRGDRAAWRKKEQRLLREAGVQPLFGLLSGLAQLFVFLAVAAVISASDAVPGAAFGWWSDLGARDGTYVLPFAIAALAVAQMRSTGKFGGRRGALVCTGTFVLFLLLTASLSAALGLAIVTNVAISLALALAFVFRSRLGRRAHRPLPGDLPVPLDVAHRHTGVGPKALRLSLLRSAGLPVPDGVVLPLRSLLALDRGGEGATQVSTALRRELARLGQGPFAVRSSALDEDGAEKSFAGIFESCLDVPTEGVPEAVATVQRSFETAAAAQYRGSDASSSCILVQKMVEADYAGVVFTRHPRHPAEMLVEYVAGCGEALVSGAADPSSFRVGRKSGQPTLGRFEDVPFPVETLIALARRCEERFGRPQDVEWAVKDGRVFVLQSRDITATGLGENTDAFRIETERTRLLGTLTNDADELRTESYCELLPTATASSLSLLHRLLGSGGAVESVRRQLGMPYRAEHAERAVTTAFGRLKVHSGAAASLFPKRRLPGLSTLRAEIRLERVARRFDDAWEARFAQSVDRWVRMERSRDLGLLALEDLADVLESRADAFAKEFYAEVELLNVVAARAEAMRGAGHGSHLGETSGAGSITARGIHQLRAVARGELDLDQYLTEFGHRARIDYELSLPRFREDLGSVRQLAAAADRGGVRTGQPASTGEASLEQRKETARHHVLKILATLREVLCELGGRGLGHRVFHLTIEEAIEYCRHADRREVLESLAQERLEADRTFRAFLAPDEHEVLDGTVLERLGVTAPPANDGELRGTSVCGDQVVRGRVRVLRPDEPLPQLESDQILVARQTDTSLAPLFTMVRGLITEIGGTLSHAAIVAREFKLPTIVGVRGATTRLEDGDLVELHPDGAVVVVDESKLGSVLSLPRGIPVDSVRGGKVFSA